ncbi:M48 family metallopeptidase [Herbaspirillum sp. SJZ107]|uniref:tetratricopeptide repeat protein n=1 Tax=Herbaspirillum sp. SJZ107 TaxID=2572881 RepID=UPI0011506698|nr:tetratricopeptide repeat protein [Herbaspirillum sp. SJZ107]TQK11187.1 MSHA biogenesis protein MshN [Herbaspirillum sp. SJZ107]
MSLINKMLQDLDARGTAPGEALPSQIKPVAREPHGVNKRMLAAGVGGAFAAVAVVWFGWQQLHAPGVASAPLVAKPASAAVPAPVPVPAAAKAPPQMTSTITMLPAGTPASEPASAPVAEPPAAQAPEPAPVVAARAAASEPPAPAKAEARPVKPEAPQARRDSAAPKHKAAIVDTLPARVAYQSVAPVEPDSEEARAVRRALTQELEARLARKPFAPAGTIADSRNASARTASGRNQSVSQRAEAEYRRALSSMQDGRMGETIASLESALRIDPGHEAARQTLVGLLIEAKRPDDAIRQLQLGLTQDPRQPALAMLLARLQIERGGNGIETLTRTLPYAGANPDYHAFLAGALQRQQRHREAAAEYQAALRSVPGNGVWWMGMGISLQAEKRNSEALEAFQKAQGSGVLSAELQAFVERQIRQLGR